MSLKINIDCTYILEELEEKLQSIDKKIKEQKEQEAILFWKNKKINILNDLNESLKILEEQQKIIKKMIIGNV